MYQRVLVPVDGSELCTAAVDQVSHLISIDGKVVIVEVIDSIARIVTQTTPAGFAFNGAMLTPEILEEIVDSQRQAAGEHLAAAQARLQRAGLSNIETRVIEGVPGSEIVDAAHELDVDVVVMATHGRSGLRRTVLGSVADYVIRHLHGVPVVLIHPADDEGEQALQQTTGAART